MTQRQPQAVGDTQHGLGGIAEVVEQRAHVPRIVGQLVDDRWHPQDDTERRGDDDVAVEPAPLPRRHAECTDRQHAAGHEIGHVRLGAKRSGDHEWHEHQRVAARHRPRGEQDDEPDEQRQVGVPRLREQQLAVAVDRDGEQRSDADQTTPAGATLADPQRRGDRRDVDRHRRRLQRPRCRPEQPVERGEEVEAQRSGVAALVGVLADPPRQSDQRGVLAEHIADVELGHGQVEDRIPVRSGKVDKGAEQRHGDNGGRPEQAKPAMAGAPAAECLAGAHEVHEGVTLAKPTTLLAL